MHENQLKYETSSRNHQCKPTNNEDYWSKNHPPTHHQNMQSEFLMLYKNRLALIHTNHANLALWQGCVKQSMKLNQYSKNFIFKITSFSLDLENIKEKND